MALVTFREGLGRPMSHAELDANFRFLAGARETKVIANGIVTLSGAGQYQIDTEGGAASDDLTQIQGLPEGQVAELSITSASRVVTVVHGTIRLESGLNRLMDSVYDTLWVRNRNGVVIMINWVSIP